MSSYKPSKLINTFHIAGIKYHDAYTVIDKIKLGSQLSVEAELDNPHDENAVALLFDGVMLGYIPRTENAIVGKLCRFGHAGAFEARVMKVDPEAAPWEQVMVGLYVKEA